MEAGDYEDPESTGTVTGELDRTKSPEVETAVSEKRIRSLNEELLRVPEGFTIHRKLRKARRCLRTMAASYSRALSRRRPNGLPPAAREQC